MLGRWTWTPPMCWFLSWAFRVLDGFVFAARHRLWTVNVRMRWMTTSHTARLAALVYARMVPISWLDGQE